MNTHTPQKSDQCKTADKAFLVVGLVRNCEKHLKTDVIRLKSAFGKTKDLHWLLIESDSTDNTVSILSGLTNEIERFKYISLGTLRSKMPLRTERISHCRNMYVDQILNNETYKHIDYVIVSDFDGLNTHISSAAIESCWEREDWDMCAANQRGPYYDIWALRHEDWNPNDCWAQYRFLNRYTPNTEKNLYSSIYSKMIRLPVSSDWIEVDSAFGGLAIYKKNIFSMGRYVGVNDKGEEFCEHVYFHNQLRQHGARLFINPRLINAEYTEHTEQLLLKKAMKRKARAIIRRTLQAITGKQ